jgi:hypothetical protein
MTPWYTASLAAKTRGPSFLDGSANAPPKAAYFVILAEGRGSTSFPPQEQKLMDGRPSPTMTNQDDFSS